MKPFHGFLFPHRREFFFAFLCGKKFQWTGENSAFYFAFDRARSSKVSEAQRGHQGPSLRHVMQLLYYNFQVRPEEESPRGEKNQEMAIGSLGSNATRQ